MKKNGQAIVEFVVAIIAVIVLVAGMVHIGITSKIHTDVMAKAREDAGMHMLTPVVGSGIPDFASSVQDGADGVNYSADDEIPNGNVIGVQTIAGYTHPGDLAGTVGNNMMTDIFIDPSLVIDGFVSGHDLRTVQMLPVIRDLVNGEQSFDVESKVWMVDLGDLY